MVIKIEGSPPTSPTTESPPPSSPATNKSPSTQSTTNTSNSPTIIIMNNFSNGYHQHLQQNPPTNHPEPETYMGNAKRITIQNIRKPLRIIGNGNKLFIQQNSSVLEIIGNSNRVRIIDNQLGSIKYRGNHGRIYLCRDFLKKPNTQEGDCGVSGETDCDSNIKVTDMHNTTDNSNNNSNNNNNSENTRRRTNTGTNIKYCGMNGIVKLVSKDELLLKSPSPTLTSKKINSNTKNETSTTSTTNKTTSSTINSSPNQQSKPLASDQPTNFHNRDHQFFCQDDLTNKFEKKFQRFMNASANISHGCDRDECSNSHHISCSTKQNHHHSNHHRHYNSSAEDSNIFMNNMNISLQNIYDLSNLHIDTAGGIGSIISGSSSNIINNNNNGCTNTNNLVRLKTTTHSNFVINHEI